MPCEFGKGGGGSIVGDVEGVSSGDTSGLDYSSLLSTVESTYNASDPLGGQLGLVAEDYAWVTRQIVRTAERLETCHGRVVSVLEGGYDVGRTTNGLAQAVQALFTDAQVTLGPWTGDGFYYDFALPEPFAEADLKRIKKEMDRIIKRRLPLSCEEVSASEARRRLEERGEGYKLQILDRIGERARPLSH